jgi:chromate transporter
VVVAAMSDNSATLAALALTFAPLSLLAVGGANAVIPEMHRQAVDVAGWMTDRQFAELFAIAQVAPGPNIIIVTLIGFHVAGIAGALAATTAMVGPSCVLTYFAARTWERFRAAHWRIVIQAGLVPVSVGLIGASALVLARTADVSWVAVLLTLATAAVGFFTRVHPLWMFVVAAAVGYAGWV